MTGLRVAMTTPPTRRLSSAHGQTLAGGGHLFARVNLTTPVRITRIRRSSSERFPQQTADTHTVAHTFIPRLCIIVRAWALITMAQTPPSVLTTCFRRPYEGESAAQGADLPNTFGVSRLSALSPGVRQGTLTTSAVKGQTLVHPRWCEMRRTPWPRPTTATA